MKTSAFLLFAVAALSSCSSIMDDDYSRIDPKIRPYVIQFVKEAEARGVAVDTFNLKVNFVSELSGGAQGRTFHESHSIIILESSYGWKNTPSTLVFHELGHLYLNREHDNTILYDQVKSIMSSEYDPDFDDAEKKFKRQYYIDELFNPATEMPKWEVKQDTTASPVKIQKDIDFSKG